MGGVPLINWQSILIKLAQSRTISRVNAHSKKTLCSLLVLAVLFHPAVASAQEPDEKEIKDPFGTVEDAIKLRRTMSVQDMSAFIKNRINGTQFQNAGDYFLTAELMKQVGDYRAQEYYEKSILADDAEPAYELFYADYLRNFRGPQRPLFPEAERHYFEGWRKVRAAKVTKPWHKQTGDRIERGLIALYQEDGLPVLSSTFHSAASDQSIKKPTLFLSSINRFAKSTGDLDEVHDVRDFTSEALFASSLVRLNRALTRDELRGIIRIKEPAATFERLRFRQDEWPVVDFFYQRREIEDAQITNFFEPNEFNKVSLNDFGVAVEKPFNVAPYFDFYLRGAYRRIERKGVIEFLPSTTEAINQVEGKAVISRFFGPDKANLEFTYAFQDINPDMPDPPRRDRRIIGATMNYQVLRPLPFLRNPYGERFTTRGLQLSAGVALDKERFGVVDVKRHDYFFGTSLNGIGRFDITFQPSFFTSKVSGDKSQNNSQFRTDLIVLFRVVDEERQPGMPDKRFLGLHPAFVHLIFPFKKDVALDGLNEFENYKAGLGLNMKFFTEGFHDSALNTSKAQRFWGTTFLVSLRYDHQRFHRLDRNLNLFSVGVSMGF